MKKKTSASTRKILAKRLRRDNFFGLKLSILTLIIFTIFALFAAVIADILPFEKLFILDHSLDNFFTSTRSSGLINFFLIITALALPQFTVGISSAFAVLLLIKKKIKFFWPFVVTLVGGLASNYASKLSFQRGRPLNATYLESSYSFPSGHATTAVVLYGFLLYYFWKQTHSRRKKNLILFGGLIVILLIGFSRIYLGVHFFERRHRRLLPWPSVVGLRNWSGRMAPR